MVSHLPQGHFSNMIGDFYDGNKYINFCTPSSKGGNFSNFKSREASERGLAINDVTIFVVCYLKA